MDPIVKELRDNPDFQQWAKSLMETLRLELQLLRESTPQADTYIPDYEI